MMSPVEMRRILAEWRLRLQRIKEIVQPPSWAEPEWRQFSQALALLVRQHGRSWIIDPNVYWDLRWKLQEGGELIAQVEHVPGEKTSLVVAQNGGFAEEIGSYTWLWAEFNMEGDFSRDPYWVDGTWKDALTTLLLPLERQANYLLAGMAQTPDSLLLQEGARPNDGNYPIAFLTQGEERNGASVFSSAPAFESKAEEQSEPRQEEAIVENETNGTEPHPASTVPPLSRTDYQYDSITRQTTPKTDSVQQNRPAVFLHR
jgi:hypothetical protein